MKINNHVLLLCILQVELRLGNTYAFDFIAKLLQAYGFARPNWWVRQLIKWPLLHGPLDALTLLEDPLARVNPAESKPLLEKLQRVAGDALTATDSSAAPATDTPSHEFSLFAGPITNIEPYSTTSLYKVWRQIVAPNERRQHKLDEVRAKYAPKGENKAYSLAKSQLPYVTFAGVFTKRNTTNLVRPSGLGVLDYDHYPDVKKLRADLINNEECRSMLALVFVSPSGRGLKLVVRLPEDAPDYATGLRAVHEWLKRHYPVLGEFHDSAGLDIARACFFSHDPDAWLHPDFRPEGE